MSTGTHEKYYSLPRAAHLMGVHHKKLQRWVVAGKVRYTRIGRMYVMSGSDITDAMERYRKGDRANWWDARPVEYKVAA